MHRFKIIALLLGLYVAPLAAAEELLVEAESFTNRGGWKLDTQFIHEMGSPYLLAHGLGRPVDDAKTTVEIPAEGSYHVWVRTKDWVARWNAPGTPGRFRIGFGDKVLADEFGTRGAEWGWHRGGTIRLAAGPTTVRLIDQTGFDGRCDCIYLTTDGDAQPPDADAVLGPWRREMLGLPENPPPRGPYDLVVIGGGYSGMGAALSAARMGCKVALVQDRPVLGGNGSSEVRVWAMGLIRRGRFPRIGEIVDEFADNATKSPGTYDEFGDALKEQIVRAEPNIDLMLNHHAYAAEVENNQIVAVKAFDTRTGANVTLSGDLFADCTGHGWLGTWAGADREMTPEGRMGMSNMWRWDERDQPASFPETPWALQLTMDDFPYPRDHHGQWFWEGGFDKDPLYDAEGIRDWNLRAVYGAFNAMKNGDGAADHENAVLTWVAFIGGPRESQRLMGDIILTQDDIVAKRSFPDGCVPSTWSIDLHYPKEQYAQKYPDNPFISKAVHDRRIDRMYGYPIPYRCFYSRNINNLFMAGRCISVTHEALGTTRVMKTCGMMGEVVGKAASLCELHDCLPRDVYESHLSELLDLLQLPGKARAEKVGGDIVIPDDALPLAGPYGPPTGIDPAELDGVVVDDREAELTGAWTEGSGLKGYVGYGYRYARPAAETRALFRLAAPADGRYEVRLAYQPHENRASAAPVKLSTAGVSQSFTVDMQVPAADGDGWQRLDTLSLKKDQVVEVTLETEQSGGYVHVDAVQLRPVR